VIASKLVLASYLFLTTATQQPVARSTQVFAPIKFSGEVSAGQTFEKAFDPGLIFRLMPVTDQITPGWEIQVAPREDPNFDYSSVVTTPFRGFNPRFLFVGYGFSAQGILEMNSRGFRFVRHRADFERAQKNVSVILGHTVPDGKDPKEAFEDALRNFESIPYCLGSLRIVDSRLAESKGPVSPIIERIKFEVELCGR
jgi:hypothetical protein